MCAYMERVCATCACTVSVDVRAQGGRVCAKVGVHEEHAHLRTTRVHERRTRVEDAQPQGAVCKCVAAQGARACKGVHACERVYTPTHV